MQRHFEGGGISRCSKISRKYSNRTWYMWCVRTYLMSSNSPSGGMKLMLLSDSNLLSLTHWWKVQSSMATLLRSLLPDLLAVINTHNTTIGVRTGKKFGILLFLTQPLLEELIEHAAANPTIAWPTPYILHIFSMHLCGVARSSDGILLCSNSDKFTLAGTVFMQL